ncbi:uncharacterized protein HMPREF1541_06040 [Cyphellophora europaea CBS 101466]|uniref:Accumulation-associated protein n=1 Tax=Cyphellophora europaea (strain CBS 101466) TaxID=1220924 RepID=W2RVT4_CYPE1|nr:uncharacterized protein HMPREF1541_06040 [Cyphellophora europaea CBS 101466]ETN39814.1 hypothetical protein HMPREF1541_06040 [Cyphellophora europaea CBS 101466]
MHSFAILLACLVTGSLAAPAGVRLVRRVELATDTVLDLTTPPVAIRDATRSKRGLLAAALPAAIAQAKASPVAAANASAGASACAAAPAAAGQAAAGGEAAAAEEEEVLLDAAFGEQVALEGGDIKQDVLYPPSPAGAFEVEFQNSAGSTLTVVENKTPAAPPAGFVAVEPSSFNVQLAGGAAGGITLQKIDYFFDVTNPAIAALDLATTQVGKLSADGCSFAIEQGELEFEADENELTLTVDDLNGEWGIFIPAAGQAGAAAAGGAEANIAAEASAAGVEEELEVEGTFDTPIAVDGGNAKTDIVFPGNVAGEFEAEYNGTAANAITVTQNSSPVPPPAGFLFVDPTTFVVSTQDATDPATDTVKIDYFYSEAVKARIDVAQGVIGKLDAASGTFVTEGLGEFEVELEENEWTLTVEDLNGEWAMLVPQTAVLA